MLIILNEGKTRICKTELSESTYALDEGVVSGAELKAHGKNRDVHYKKDTSNNKYL